jgi:hypothetical protein
MQKRSPSVTILILLILLGSSAATPLLRSANGPNRVVVGASTPGSFGTSLGNVPPSLPIAASVGFFNKSQGDLLNQTLQALYTPGSYMYHQFLSSQEYSSVFAPSPSAYQSAVSYFQSYGISTYTDPSRLFLNLVGTSSQYQQAFSTSLGLFAGTHYKFYANTGPLLLPSGIASYVTSVVGLENYTFYVPHLVKVQGTPASISNPGPSPPPLPGLGYVPSELQGIYNATGLIAKGVDGRGSTIVLIDAGYGDKTVMTDAVQFSLQFGLAIPTVNVQTVNSSSTVTDVSTDPQNGILSNFPGQPCADVGACPPGAGWDIETAMDVEYAHTMAPGANLVNMISFDPGVGIDEAVATAITGTGTGQLPTTTTPTRGLIISQSFGQCECVANITYAGGPAIGGDGTYTDPFYKEAAALGETVLASSGDTGNTQLNSNGHPVVDTSWPAADRWVTAVGGTTILPPESLPLTGATSTYQGENAWSGSGGGYSTNNATSPDYGGGIPRPSWQTGPGIPTSGFNAKWRGVPDVSMEADSATGVDVVVDGGQNTGGVWGGTSLASPLYAGSLAVYQDYNNAVLGFYNPFAYAIFNSQYYTYAFHDVDSGNNGFAAGPGWDPATGIGSPNVGNFVTCTQGTAGVKCAGVAKGPSPGVTITSPTSGQTVTTQTLSVSGTHTLAPGNFQIGQPDSAVDVAGNKASSLNILQAWFSDYRTLATGQKAFNVNIRVQNLTNILLPSTGALGEHWEIKWSFGGSTNYAEMLEWYTSGVTLTGGGRGLAGIFFYAGTITTNTTGTTVAQHTVNGSYTAAAPGLITITVPAADVTNPVSGSTFASASADAQQFIGTPALWLQFTVHQALTPSSFSYRLGDPLGAAGFVQVALNNQYVGGVNGTLVGFPDSNHWTATLNLAGLPSGAYSVYARQVVGGIPGISASVPFNLVGVATAKGTLAVQSNAKGYTPGHRVLASGTLKTPTGQPLAGMQVGVELNGPSGSTLFLDQVTTTSTGSYQTTFSLPTNAPAGTYTLRAAVWGLTASTTFTVGSNIRGSSVGASSGTVLSSPSSVAITGLQILNGNGQPQATFTKGQQVQVKITVSNSGSSPQAIQLAVEFLNPHGTPVFIGLQSVTVGAGQTASVTFSATPGTTFAYTRGNYFTLGFAWNGLISHQGNAWDAFAPRASAIFQAN